MIEFHSNGRPEAGDFKAVVETTCAAIEANDTGFHIAILKAPKLKG